MSNEFINLDSGSNTREDFQLRYISISKYEGDWQSLPHTHQFSELFYVLSGEGAFYIEDDKIPVKADDLMIINPHVEHTEKTLPNDPMEYIVFGVEGLAFSFIDPDQDNTKGYSFYSYGSDKNQFINFAQLMMREFHEKKPGFEKVCHGLLQVLLVYISRKQNLSVISDSSFQLSKECALAKRYIDANYAQNITLDSGTLFYRMHRPVSDQLSDRPKTGSLQGASDILESFCRSGCLKRRILIPVLFFTNLQKKDRYDAETVSESLCEISCFCKFCTKNCFIFCDVIITVKTPQYII